MNRKKRNIRFLTLWTVCLTVVSYAPTSHALSQQAVSSLTPYSTPRAIIKAPSAPLILSVDTSTSRTITLFYTLGNANGSAITHVQYSTNGGASWESTTNNPITIPQLTNGVIYRLRLRAVNAVGYSPNAARSVKPIATKNTINFAPLLPMTLSSPDQEPVLSATGGTNLLMVTTARTCSIVNGKIHPLAIGVCSVRATNPGDATYAKAANVTRSLVISKILPPSPSPTATSTPTPSPTATLTSTSVATIRLTSPLIDRSNSLDGTSEAASWVASHWYAPGLRHFTHEAFVGDTINLTYRAVDQNQRPIANHAIYLSANKACSGSTATLTTPGRLTPIGPTIGCTDSATLSSTTNNAGYATFTLTNVNTANQTGHFTDMFINYSGESHLYSQFMPSIFGPAKYSQNPVTKEWSRNPGPYDIEDITTFIWSKPLPASPSPPTCAAGYLWCAEFNDPAGLLSSSQSGNQWLPNIGTGCPLLCGVAGNSHTVHTDTANHLDGLGNLVITASKVSNSTWTCENDSSKTCVGEWTTGRIWTRNRVGFTYGKIEARMKLPAGSGTHAAFWMVGADIPNNPWPGSGEIDIMEANGNMPATNWMTAHQPPVPCVPYCEGNQHEQRPYANTMQHSEPLTDGYHTYGILWEPDKIQWTFDGVVKTQVLRSDFSCSSCWSFNKEFYLYLNLSMFDGFTGITDPTMTSTDFLVDWVRYSRYNGHGTLTMH